MARIEEEFLPTETIALVVYELTRRRRMTTQQAAVVGSYTIHGVDAMLNKACRTIPLAKTGRGEWAIVDAVTDAAEQVRPLLHRLQRELAASEPGDMYCRPLKRADVAELVLALRVFLHE